MLKLYDPTEVIWESQTLVLTSSGFNIVESFGIHIFNILESQSPPYFRLAKKRTLFILLKKAGNLEHSDKKPSSWMSKFFNLAFEYNSKALSK